MKKLKVVDVFFVVDNADDSSLIDWIEETNLGSRDCFDSVVFEDYVLTGCIEIDFVEVVDQEEFESRNYRELAYACDDDPPAVKLGTMSATLYTDDKGKYYLEVEVADFEYYIVYVFEGVDCDAC